MKLAFTTIMFSALSMQQSAAFLARKTARAVSSSAFKKTSPLFAAKGQAEVVLVGCGAPNRGMGWYHAVQMMDKK
jgi:hypothetical protein